MAHRRDPDAPVPHIWDTLDLVEFQVILESFGALVSQWDLKRAGRRAKRNAIWDFVGTCGTFISYL